MRETPCRPGTPKRHAQRLITVVTAYRAKAFLPADRDNEPNPLNAGWAIFDF